MYNRKSTRRAEEWGMQEITSTQNEKIRALKALSQKKGREEAGCFLVESVKMVREAADSMQVLTVLVDASHVDALMPLLDKLEGMGTQVLRAPEHVLKSGASGSIVVPHVASSAVIIPQDAVVQVQDKYFVYVVGKDNKVKYTPVTVNPQNDGKNYIITSGLSVGDRFVVNGVSSLQDGMDIKPLTEAQYAEKLKKTEELGEAQGDLGKLKKAFGK